MMKRAQLLAFVTVVAAPIALGAPALGAECIGVQFPDSVKMGDADLALNGLGLRKATFLKVKVYVAGLYLPKKSGDGGLIAAANQPWKLVLHFVHDADASDIRDALDEGFKNAAGDKIDGLRKRIDELKTRMVDFKESQYLAYSYDPTKGTIVDVNGAGAAAIEGADFAAALLTIWIGPEPPNKELKSGLLGGKCE